MLRTSPTAAERLRHTRFWSTARAPVADNADNPDPSATVHWGDQTWEEMQYTGMLYSVNSRRLKPAAK